MNKKMLYAVIGTMAILHNGKRYEKGDKIELTAEEAENLSLYIELDQSEAEKQKEAEGKAEKEPLAAEKAQKKAEEKTKEKADK